MKSIEVKIVNKGYNRRFSLPKELSKTDNPKETLVLFEVDEKLYLKFPVFAKHRKMYFGIPCEITQNRVKINIRGIFSEKELLQRKKEIFKIINGTRYVNLKAILAKEVKLKTARRGEGTLKLYTVEIDNKLYIFPRIFIMHKQPIITNKYISLDDFAAIFGFYFTEGGKTRMFTITNSEKEVMDKFLKIIYKNFNFSSFISYCVVEYVPDENHKTENELRNYWKDLLKKYDLKLNLVVYIDRKGKDRIKGAKYGSFSFRLSTTSPLYSILGIIKSPVIGEIIKNKDLAWEILRWMAAGDIFPKIDKRGLNAIAIATDISEEVEFYKELLMRCDIRYDGEKVTKNKEILITGLDNITKLFINDIFRYILYRKQRFTKSLILLPVFTHLKYFRNKKTFSLNEFVNFTGINYGSANMLLNKWYQESNLVRENGNDYSLTNFGNCS